MAKDGGDVVLKSGEESILPAQRIIDGYRAIAYHLEGYLCALLDGHHKAVAVALDNKKVKSFVIVPASLAWKANKKQNIKGRKFFCGLSHARR